MLAELRQEVLEANLLLPRLGLVTLTWGNASGIDRQRGLMVIKPSGVAYGELTPSSLVVVDFDGKVVEGDLRPSSDTATHLELYRRLSDIGGVVHTHSTHATAFAQARAEIPVLGTTHADLSPLPVPVARELTRAEVTEAYEVATGHTLIEAVGDRPTDQMPAVLAPGHGPFVWGHNAIAAVENAAALEEVARIAILTLGVRSDATSLAGHVRDKHYFRKHGPAATYGQSNHAP